MSLPHSVPGMTQHHVAVLGTDEVIALFEEVRAGGSPCLPDAVQDLVPESSSHAQVEAPALEAVTVDEARAAMVLGASREVTGHGTLVPGDLLVLDAPGTVTVEASDDPFDESVLLVVC